MVEEVLNKLQGVEAALANREEIVNMGNTIENMRNTMRDITNMRKDIKSEFATAPDDIVTKIMNQISAKTIEEL